MAAAYLQFGHVLGEVTAFLEAPDLVILGCTCKQLERKVKSQLPALLHNRREEILMDMAREVATPTMDHSSNHESAYLRFWAFSNAQMQRIERLSELGFELLKNEVHYHACAGEVEDKLHRIGDNIWINGLHFAAAMNDVQLCRMLLERGADVNEVVQITDDESDSEEGGDDAGNNDNDNAAEADPPLPVEPEPPGNDDVNVAEADPPLPVVPEPPGNDDANDNENEDNDDENDNNNNNNDNDNDNDNGNNNNIIANNRFYDVFPNRNYIVNPDALDYGKITALRLATVFGNQEAAEYLREKGGELYRTVEVQSDDPPELSIPPELNIPTSLPTIEPDDEACWVNMERKTIYGKNLELEGDLDSVLILFEESLKKSFANHYVAPDRNDPLLQEFMPRDDFWYNQPPPSQEAINEASDVMEELNRHLYSGGTIEEWQNRP